MMEITVIKSDGGSETTMVYNADFAGNIEITDECRYGGKLRQWMIPGWIVKAIRENAVNKVLGWLEEFPICDVEVA
jgi:hypothetical protein